MTGAQIQELVDTYVNGNKSDVISRLRKLPRLKAAYVAVAIDRALDELGYTLLPLLSAHMHERGRR